MYTFGLIVIASNIKVFFSVIAYSLKMVFMSFPTLLCLQLRGYLVKCKLLTDGETLGGEASLVASHC